MQVYIKDLKDVPERLYDLWGREWLRTIDLNKLPVLRSSNPAMFIDQFIVL
jgi:hypothetical protein